MIYGQIGNGKTTFSKTLTSVINALVEEHAFSEGDINQWDYMVRVNAMDLIEAFLDNKDLYKSYRSQSWLLIDDVGTEPPFVNMYGTVFRPMTELLFYRYEHRLPTVFVTNYRLEGDGTERGKGLFDIYTDPRFKDRFKQMFNVVLFRDNSFRR